MQIAQVLNYLIEIKMEIKNLFVVRATNEENNSFIITIGKHLATERKFKTKEEALAYIDTPKWDTIATLCCEMIDAHKVNEQIKKDTEKVIKSIIKDAKEGK